MVYDLFLFQRFIYWAWDKQLCKIKLNVSSKIINVLVGLIYFDMVYVKKQQQQKKTIYYNR